MIKWNVEEIYKFQKELNGENSTGWEIDKYRNDVYFWDGNNKLIIASKRNTETMGNHVNLVATKTFHKEFWERLINGGDGSEVVCKLLKESNDNGFYLSEENANKSDDKLDINGELNMAIHKSVGYLFDNLISE